MSAKPFSIRFWQKVDRSAGASGCWLWTASSVDGYGRIKSDQPRRLVLAHRASYEMAYGPLPAGVEVCHTCDTPSCVNPAHLFAGSHSDNMRDAARKGRITVHDQRGELNAMHKLTAEKVNEIRRCYAAGGTTQKELSLIYRVHETAIYKVIHLRTWRHL